jgi:alpha-1,6-mannosyltransferase
MGTPGTLAAPPLGPSRLSLARARPALAAGSLTVLAGCGVAIALGGSDRHSSIVQGSGRGLPGWLAGPLSGLGLHLTLAQFYLVVAAMGVAYGIAVAFAGELRTRWLVGSIVLLHALFLLAPPLLSTDVFNYINYARLGALHGFDPYVHGAIAARHDPSFLFTAWRHTGSAYGPLFTLASYPLAFIGVPGALWAFKLVAALASLGCVALVWKIAEQLGRLPVRAAAIFGLNPLLLVWTVGGAHNDLLMLLLLLAGVLLVLRRREALGGAALLASVAIKATSGIAIPFVLLGAQRRWRAVAGLAVAAVVVGVAAAIAFPGHPLGVLDVLGRQQQTLVAFDSVPSETAALFGVHTVTHGVRLASAVLLALALAWLFFRVWRRGADWVGACGWALAAVVGLSAWFLAWYAVWPLAFAAVSRDRRLLTVVVAIQAYFVINHIPGFTMMPR